MVSDAPTMADAEYDVIVVGGGNAALNAAMAARHYAERVLLLVIHLATVFALFLTMPYSKFAHFVYRYAALVQNRLEERRDGRRSSLRPGSGDACATASERARRASKIRRVTARTATL